jgi:hypothetical protein
MERYKIIEQSTGNVYASMLSDAEMLERLNEIGTDKYYPDTHQIEYMKYVVPETKVDVLCVMLVDGLEYCTVNYNGGVDFRNSAPTSKDWYALKNYIPATKDDFMKYAKLAINKIVDAIS